MTKQFARAAILPLLAAVALSHLTAPVHAADASPWDSDQRSAARLIGGRPKGEGAARIFRAGIEIKLQPGWKTYWRYPGDSGLPPRFDFAGSQNVKTADVLYPAPVRFPDGAGGHSIGYSGTVIFPVHVVAQDAAKPVLLRIQLDYAACEKLCIPAKANAELSLGGAASAQEGALSSAEARVPKPGAIGQAAMFSVAAVRRDATPGKPRVLVDMAVPNGVNADLFAEGPTADWALPLPEPVAGAPAGMQRFRFEIDGAPPGVKPDGAMLRLTATAGDDAIEVPLRLD